MKDIELLLHIIEQFRKLLTNSEGVQDPALTLQQLKQIESELQNGFIHKKR